MGNLSTPPRGSSGGVLAEAPRRLCGFVQPRLGEAPDASSSAVTCSRWRSAKSLSLLSTPPRGSSGGTQWRPDPLVRRQAFGSVRFMSSQTQEASSRYWERLILVRAAIDRGVTAGELAMLLRVSVDHAQQQLDQAASDGLIQVVYDQRAVDPGRVGEVYRAHSAALAGRDATMSLDELVDRHRELVDRHHATLAARRRAVSAIVGSLAACAALAAGVRWLTSNGNHHVLRASSHAAGATTATPAASEAPTTTVMVTGHDPSMTPELRRIRRARLRLEATDLRARLVRHDASAAHCDAAWQGPDSVCYVDGRMVTRSTFAAERDELQILLGQKQRDLDVLGGEP